MTVELPKDAKGRDIPLDTECPYTCNGEKQEVISFMYYRIGHILDDFEGLAQRYVAPAISKEV